MAKFGLKSLIVAIMSMPLFALAANNEIACPEAVVTKIAAEFLDTVTRYDMQSHVKYTIYSASQKINIENLSWSFSTGYKSMRLDDYNKAFAEGQATLRSDLKLHNQYAIDDGQRYLCAYKNNQGELVAIASAEHKNDYLTSDRIKKLM